MERKLSPAERDAFLRKHFQVGADGLIKEERKSNGGFLVSIGDSREYRAAHLALPPGRKRLSPAELEACFDRLNAWIDELEAGATAWTTQS